MSKYIFIIILFTQYISLNAQQISMRVEPSTTNQDIIRLHRFEGIDTEKFVFVGKEILGKNFQIICKEFKDGNPINSFQVFDSSEDEYFRLKEDKLEFYVYSKIEEDQFKIQFQFKGFSSTKKYPIVYSLKDEYALKNFLGAESEIKIDMNSQYILALLTPYVTESGYKSYCEVAQSEINPEELGKKYNLPHYFLIEIKFL